MDFLEVLNEFLLVGSEEQRESRVPKFEAVMRVARTGSEVVLLRCVRLAVAHLSTLAISRFRWRLPGALTSRFVNLLLNEHIYCFLPPQYSILESGFLDSDNRNRLVTIPTSTGKTLLAEFAIIRSLEAGPGLSIFAVPYIALGNQVFESLKKHAPENTRIQGLFGGFRADSDLNPGARREIVVATTERVDALLRSRDLYPWLRLVVFDEAHSIEAGVRGARMEALITRLRLMQARGSTLQLLLLSAVLTEASSIRNWLGDSTQHFQDGWRPTARRIAIWDYSGKLSWMHGNDPLRPSAKSGSSDLGSKPLPWPEPMYATDKFGQKLAQMPSVYSNVEFLARYLASSLGSPILIVCGTKAATRGAAKALARKLPMLRQQYQEIDALVSRVSSDDAKHLSPLAEMAKRGVAYHNASLPPDIRKLIEAAIRVRAISFVCATTTLAEGVDLPFRTTILLDWLLGFKERQRPMSPLLFRNIAGRCGRAGAFTEGDTVIFDNMLGDLKYTQEATRRDFQNTLFSDPPELRSAIANTDLPKDDQAAVNAAISSQLLAAIPENPTDDLLEDSFAEQLYVSFTGGSAKALLGTIRKELLSASDGEPFAIAASPMRLTPLGEAANRTGFSPSTCRQIISYLQANEMSEPVSWTTHLLAAVGGCPEQNNMELREIALNNRTRFYAKASDIGALNLGWLRNEPLPDLFASLPKALSSKGQVHPSAWIQGGGESEIVAGQYDKFVDFMEQTFAGFLPWLLRACEQLSVVIDGPAKVYPWRQLAELYETARAADTEQLEGPALPGTQ